MKLPPNLRSGTTVHLPPPREAVSRLVERTPVRLRVPWEPRRQQSMSTGRKAALGVGLSGLAALLALFLDVRRGKARLHVLSERSRAAARHGTRRVRTRTAYAGGRARGRVARLLGKGTPSPVDDIEVKNQVRQVLARHGFHRADVLVDVCDRMATLRGQLATSEEIDLAESLVREVPGVEGLVNLLHLPGSPAANKVLALREM